MARPVNSARRLPIDALAQRNDAELGIGGLILVQIGGEEAHDIVVAELFRPGDQVPYGEIS
jgi:hypothetical protein